MKYICQYCGRECKTASSLSYHQNRCKLNPNAKHGVAWNTDIWTKERILNYNNEKFNNKFTFYFDKDEYKRNDKIKFICPEDGEIEQTIAQFINSSKGCIKCSKRKASKNKSKEKCENKIKEKINKINNLKEIKKNNIIINDFNFLIDKNVIYLKYTFNNIEYLSKPLKYGNFINRSKYGCNQISNIINGKNKSWTLEKVIQKASQTRKDFYDFEIISLSKDNKYLKAKCKKCNTIGEIRIDAFIWGQDFCQCKINNKKIINKKTEINNYLNNILDKYKILCLESDKIQILSKSVVQWKCLCCNRIFKSTAYDINKQRKKCLCKKNKHLFYSNEKLNILTQYDLLSMSWSVILDLIGEDKLPKEFSKLCKFGENTPERKKMIDDLIDTYNIEVDNKEDENDIIDNENNVIDNENDINTDIETKVNDIDDEIYGDINNEDELKPYKEIKDLGELLDKDFDETLFSTGDKWDHIMSKEISRLWNNVLRDNENHNENTINEIHQKLINNSLTKFEKYVYEEFIKEYNEVINLEIH